MEGRVTMGHLREGKPSFMSAFAALLAGSPDNGDATPVGGGPEGAAARAQLFIAINASAVELADLGGWEGWCGWGEWPGWGWGDWAGSDWLACMGLGGSGRWQLECHA